MSSVTTRIEPLGKENFDTWRLQIEALLIKNDTWNYVSGEEIKPKLIVGNAESEANVKKWIVADQKARSDLILAISPTELKQIKNCETSNAVWKKLHEIYQSKGPARKATLLKRLILHKMADGIDIKTHISDFFDTVDKLMDMDITIHDDLLAVMLLYSLPESLDNFRCAIESRDELPKPEILKIKILEEFEARKSKEDENSQNAMLIRKNLNRNNAAEEGNNWKNSRKPFQRSFNFKCHRCRKVGHKASECRSKRRQHAEATESSRTCVEKEKTHIPEEIAFKYTEKKFTERKEDWCLDSGCTSHMTADQEEFNQLRKITKPLSLANGGTTTIHGVGEIKFLASDGASIKNLRLENVMFVPDLRTNLMSVAKITDKGYQVIFTKERASIIGQDGVTKAIADRKGDLYFVRKEKEIANSISTKSSISEWHQKLGHVNVNSLVDMAKTQRVLGLTLTNNKYLQCETCIKAKQAQSPYPKRDTNRTTDLLEIVYSDVCGPMKTGSLGGAKYFITFIDDYSRWCEVYFLNKKSEAFDVFKKYKAMVETYTGKKIKNLQTDNGTEYINQQFDNFLATNGIKRRLTAPYSPEQNGVAERKNRSLVETARSMMLDANMPPYFWAEAINTANYIRNRCGTKPLNGETPYKYWHGKKPTVRYFQIFGTKGFALQKNSTRGKFEEKSLECRFLGYSEESKAYRLWVISQRKIIISRDVRFTSDFNFGSNYEECFNDIQTDKNNNLLNDYKENKLEDANIEVTLHKEAEHQKSGKQPENFNSPAIRTRNNRGRPRILRTGKRGRPRKLRHQESRRTPREGNFNPPEEDPNLPEKDSSSSSDSPNTELEYESANLIVAEDPLSVNEALKGNNSSEWKSAIKQEILAHIKNKTWDVIDRPDGVNVINSKYVLTTKYKPNGTVDRRKARLVARGFAQISGISYHETFAPVVRMSSIRLLMALSVKHEWEVHQMDVVTAYLNGELCEEVYMELPDLLEENLKEIIRDTKDKNEVYKTARNWLLKIRSGEPKTCLLKKALYGLKQSGRAWYEKLDSVLTELKLKRSDSDPCIYVARRGSETLTVAIYVDDLIIAAKDSLWIGDLKRQLSTHFEMRDLGRIHYCLGIEFKQSDDRKEITLCQRKYSLEILNRFGMTDCKHLSTPLEVNSKLQQPKKGEEDKNKTLPYQRLIGSLMYLAVATRPDLAYTVSMLSQFNSSYSTEHWAAAKRVLRYLKGTCDYGLTYRQAKQDVKGYADSDWGSSLSDRKSYTGFTYITSGASVSWESKKQKTVALSSTEAEYIALSEAAKEAIHLRRFIAELSSPIKTLTIYNDNQGAQKLAKTPTFHNRTKHIDIRHHFIREILQDGIINIEYMPTEMMPADVLTKALTGPKHLKCISSMGIAPIT